MDRIEQLARDLLARLSHDYGDSIDCPKEVQDLFDRGEELLPIVASNPADKLEAAENLADAVAAYFNKRGIKHSERKGNEDIAEMADALSDYGYASNLAAAKK